MSILSDTDLLKVSYLKGKDQSSGSFVLEPLSPGYGYTIGHSLRRVLLSSLEGAAISSVKIDGATHEFSTIAGVKEDIVDIVLNLKSLRLRLDGNEPTVLKIEKKGPGIVTAKDFDKNSLVTIVDPEHMIATLDKNAKFSMEVTVKKGRGYEPVEQRKEEKLPLGSIAIDSVFTPIKKINYEVENTRVEGMTNYDKLTLDITTDGSISPEEAFKSATQIIVEHFSLIGEMSSKTPVKAKAKVVEEKLEGIKIAEKEVKKSDRKTTVKVEKATKKAKK